ncbi:MAG: OsmC family protein [Chitinophagaceae bacterium]
MEALNLRAIQEPLKAKYRDDPASALVTLKAMARAGEGITCKVETGRSLAEAGLHPATGGDGMLVCSGDMLLEALAACAGVTLKAVATSIGFDLQDAHIEVEGDLDFRGTLSVDKNAPVGFRAIRLKFHLQTKETSDKIATLIKLTERFCVVYQTLMHVNPIQVTVS